jgi:pantoate--beta-alanine ligase
VRKNGKWIALVPTMGALHEGHLSLVRAAKQQCEFTVATIFVNPTQFGPGEDFDRYPRTLDADVALLEREGVDLIFAPDRAEMYAGDHQTYVDVEELTQVLEGAIRPGHFRGVTTIVLKLLNVVQPAVAIFGQKDFQQAAVIQRMVRDLDVPVRIDVQPTVRESDGLAMSSRNRYLSAEDRSRALGLSRSLRIAKEAVAGGERSVDKLNQVMRQSLAQSGIESIDYAVVCDPQSLRPLETVTQPGVALLAVRLGATRLIDNEILTPPDARTSGTKNNAASMEGT